MKNLDNTWHVIDVLASKYLFHSPTRTISTPSRRVERPSSIAKINAPWHVSADLPSLRDAYNNRKEFQFIGNTFNGFHNLGDDIGWNGPDLLKVILGRLPTALELGASDMSLKIGKTVEITFVDGTDGFVGSADLGDNVL